MHLGLFFRVALIIFVLKIFNMKLQAVNTCVNCENLMRDFVCQKHNQQVDIMNVCESHIYQDSITKDSSCSNCLNFGESTCSKPQEASATMICFDWKG